MNEMKYSFNNNNPLSCVKQTVKGTLKLYFIFYTELYNIDTEVGCGGIVGTKIFII